MSRAQISQENGVAAPNPAESATSDRSPATAKPAPGNGRTNRGTTPSDRRKKSKQRAPANPAPEIGEGTPAPIVVPSVADLTATVCRNPEMRRKRLKLAESFRECGLDESKLAEYSFAIVQKLSLNSEAGPVGVANTKLLLEVLKDVAHYLEPPKTANANEASDAPQFVRLIHNVPRPVRPE
jgi:hypothetical protein